MLRTCRMMAAESMSVRASADCRTAEQVMSFLSVTVGRSTTPPSKTVMEYRCFRKNVCSLSRTYCQKGLFWGGTEKRGAGGL